MPGVAKGQCLSCFQNEHVEVYCCTLSSSLQVSPLQKCDVVNEIELDRERCENSTAGNVTSGHSTRTRPLFPIACGKII